MEKVYTILLKNKLFNHISLDDLKSLLYCLNANEKLLNKNESLVRIGDSIEEMGIIIEGTLKIIKEDPNGNEYLLTELRSGDLFLETFACMELNHSPVSIIAIEKTKVLLFNFNKMIVTCNKQCNFHTQLIENMMYILAYKNNILNQKVEILSKRTLREKVLCYLYYQAQGRKQFTIPLTRDAMANTLCADRSALSNELSKMQKEGIIRYHKNTFEIL